MTIVQLKPKAERTKLRADRASKRVLAATRRQAMSAVAVGAVGVTLTALSLSHLALGIELVTASDALHSWPLAIGIDVSFISVELAQLFAAPATRAKNRLRANVLICGTLIGSAAMNAFAFAHETTGAIMMAAAAGLGVAIPALIYALTRIAATMYMDAAAK